MIDAVRVLSIGGAVTCFVLTAPAAEIEWLPASPSKLPRWRGFNLLEKFHKSRGNHAFVEKDFRLISELGFNFVRLPMDYRLWIRNSDWELFDEDVLGEIDEAVEFGRRYGVHVCLNFHRAPGYTVARPREKTDLWTDAETQRVCARHWATFARRYRNIPNERLSFNLFNEPSHVDEGIYVGVVSKIVAAIRAEDPKRLIISDGLEWGRKPCMGLLPLKLAQMTRGYEPGALTHHKASWVSASMDAPAPTWPVVTANGMLFGPVKKELSAPFVIEGPFAQQCGLRMHLKVVSQRATLVVKADGQAVLEKAFECGPGEGEWKEPVFKKQWNIYQNVYDRDYAATIPAGTKQVTLELTEGDWITLSEIAVAGEPGGEEQVLALANKYGKAPGKVRYAPDAPGGPFLAEVTSDRKTLWQQMIVPWQAAREQGIGVMVGEWGSYNKTPHDVVLRWAEDCLKNWQEAGWGWALWNLRGSFGILDSGREDVEYEKWEGHHLDRKFLELLQRH